MPWEVLIFQVRILNCQFLWLIHKIRVTKDFRKQKASRRAGEHTVENYEQIFYYAQCMLCIVIQVNQVFHREWKSKLNTNKDTYQIGSGHKTLTLV